jgi:hypothetical protein
MLDELANAETSVPHVHQMTQRHIPKDCNINPLKMKRVCFM